MKQVKVLFLVALAVFVGALSFSTSGCKSTPTDPDSPPITDDLFPLIVGHQLVFSGHLRNANDEEIAGTSAFYEARMTVAATNTPTPFGTAHVLLDSQLVSPGVWATQSFYIQRDDPEGSGNFGFLTNIGRIYRLFNIDRSDSLRWVLLVNQSVGVNEEWEAFDSTWTGQIQPGLNGTIRLQVVAEITGPTTETYGGQTFHPYKVTATRKIYFNESPTSASEATTAEVWLEPGIGIVKFIFHADGESGGFYREYESDNF